MPENDVLNEERTSADPSAGGSAEEKWLPTKEASRLAGTSARTLKRRADLGTLRRTSVHTQFGVESHYFKEDIIKIKNELRQAAEGFADGIAEVNAELEGRHADGADDKNADRAGGDKGLLSLADPAEANRVLAKSLTKLTEPFFRLTNTLETGFDRFLHLQEDAVRSQERMHKEIVEERRVAEKNSQRATWTRSLMWLLFSAVVVGLVALGVYYGYTRISKYYAEELNLREKEISVWSGVYNGLLEQHQRELKKKELEIEELRKRDESREEVSTEEGGG